MFGRKQLLSRTKEFAGKFTAIGVLALAAGALVADKFVEYRQAGQPRMSEVTLDWMPQQQVTPVKGFPRQCWPTKSREVVRPYTYVAISPADTKEPLSQDKSIAVISTKATRQQRAHESAPDRRLVIACQDEQGGWQVAQSTQILAEVYPCTDPSEPDIIVGVPIGQTGLTICIGELMPDGTFAGHETHCDEFISPKDFAEHYAGQAILVKV